MIAKQDRPLFLLLCVIAALLLALLVLPGALVVVQFNAGDGCNQPTFGCFLYRWQTLIGGSFAIVAAVIAWTSLEVKNSRNRRRDLKGKIQKLNYTLEDLTFIIDQAGKFYKFFSSVRNTKANSKFLTYKMVRNCFRQPFPLPRFQEMSVPAKTRYQLETINNLLYQFTKQHRDKTKSEETFEKINYDDRDKIITSAETIVEQFEIFIKYTKEDISTIQNKINSFAD